MSTQDRRDLILSRQTAIEDEEQNWHRQVRGEALFWNILRISMLLLVFAVVLGTWMVSSAHLGEQFLAVPQLSAGLIDPEANQFSLSPDSIEKQVLAFNLRLREAELDIPVGTNPLPRPFRIDPGEPARFVAARLEQEGFITDSGLFNLYLRVTGLEKQIEAGQLHAGRYNDDARDRRSTAERPL